MSQHPDLRPEEARTLAQSGRCASCGHLSVLHYDNPCCSYAGCCVAECPCETPGDSPRVLEEQRAKLGRQELGPAPAPPNAPAKPRKELEAALADALRPFVGSWASPQVLREVEATVAKLLRNWVEPL